MLIKSAFGSSSKSSHSQSIFAGSAGNNQNNFDAPVNGACTNHAER